MKKKKKKKKQIAGKKAICIETINDLKGVFGGEEYFKHNK